MEAMEDMEVTDSEEEDLDPDLDSALEWASATACWEVWADTDGVGTAEADMAEAATVGAGMVDMEWDTEGTEVRSDTAADT